MQASIEVRTGRFPAVQALSGYVVATVAVATALAAHIRLDQYMGPGSFPFFLAAVAIAAWFGGPGPAFFAAILITLAVDVYPSLIAPQLAVVTVRDAVALIAFAFTATVITALVDSLRTSRLHALSTRNALASERGELLSVVRQLRERESILRGIMDGTSDAIYVKDCDGRYLAMNAAGAARLGRSVNDVVGRTNFDLIDRDVADALRAREERVLRTGTTDTREDTAVVDGEPRTFLASSGVFRDLTGNVAGLVGVATDITEQRRREHDVAEANRAKSDFLATMSHELRTPLSAIMGYGELLADGITGPVTPPQAEQLRRIRLSANHLLGLIEEVLTFSRLEAGRETAHAEPLDASQAAEEAAAIVAPLAADKGLALRVVPPGAAAVALADPQKVRQVLVNLLSNAVKFTERGEVSVEVARQAGTVALAVRDTGIGIPADQLERIWEPFTQVDQAVTRRVGGTGLGLSVSRRLARLMGGDITVTSVPGRGSEFTVLLPISDALSHVAP